MRHFPEDHIDGLRKLLGMCGIREINFIGTCMKLKCKKTPESLSAGTGSSSCREAGATATSEENAVLNTQSRQPSFFSEEA